MNKDRIALSLVAIIFAAGAPARAQSTAWTDRGYVDVSGWLQPTASFSDTVRPIDFVESSVVETGYKTRTVPGIEAGAGVRVWRNLAVGVDVSRFSKQTDAAVSAQVPHPFFFNKLRPVSGDASGLTRDETAVHLQLVWMVPLRPRWQLAIAGGPSWFAVDQDLVADVTVNQSYPFDTATFAGATTTHRSASRAGFNAGIDVAYHLRKHVGLGGGVAFSRASVPLSDTVTVDAGGAHLRGGLRFRF